MVAQKLATGRFDRQTMQDLLFSDRQYSWEITKPDVLQMCASFPGGMAPSSSGPVSAAEACAVLSKWSGRNTLDARGALVFQRFWSRVTAVQVGVQAAAQQTPIWTTPFSAADPVNTPRGLNTALPQVQLAFGDALRDLAGAGIPVNAPLGQFQVDVRPDGTRTPLQGGPGTLGVFNALAVAWNAKTGYAGQLAHGSSFIEVVSFNGSGCPDARTLLTYSQSSDPTSAHYSDQTKLFSRSGWVTDRFCEKDVAAGTLSRLHLTA
jgi:acyl-homoserine-lactone acylase